MKKWNILVLSFLLLFLFPFQVFAYAKQVVLGGDSIGIKIKAKGVLVIGFYPVNGKYIKGEPEIKIGDVITKVLDTPISSINELTSLIEKNIQDDNTISLTLIRHNKEIETTITLEKVDGVYKTGLYVKDEVTGIGTLTYIDPSTKIYGALGHEIIESTTSELVEVKTGQIFESTVTSINKSIKGNAGSKNASFNLNHLYGNILTNETHGIYGNYTDDIPEANIDIALPNEIKVGKASLYTVLDGQDKQAYDISITEIREYNDVKNITFTITDEDLLAKTGGVIQGMSGSPIVQNDKLIGAVTHVVVDNPLTGYGIFITTMLETGDQFAH